MKTTRKLFKMSIALSLVLSVTNCKKDEEINKVENQTITGFVQKGPFINGSSVTVYDLQSDLTPTGKSFNTQITDNKGTFQISAVSLSSNYASLRADGFYFNEVSGQQSAAQITLYALSDIASKTDVNINILTHLEKARVEYLIKNGKTFADAKTQAQKEVLAIFNIEKSDATTSEHLNIAQSGDNNGILLTVSAILQGIRSESEMTELLSNISNDIKEDGVLNSETLGSALLSQAKILDTTAIKTNITKRYSELGATASIPSFGKYLANFIANTKFTAAQSLITYPETGLNGSNILSLTTLQYGSGTNNFVSLATQLNKGTTVKIKITALSTSDTAKTQAKDSSGVAIPLASAIWYYAVGSEINWLITDFNTSNHTQTFTSIETGKSCDLKMFFDKGSFLIEYFEMNATTPTRSKIITVK